MGSVSGQGTKTDVGAIAEAIIEVMAAGGIKVTRLSLFGYTSVMGRHPTEGVLKYVISSKGVRGPNPAEELGHMTSMDALRANIGDALYALHDMEYNPAAKKFVPLQESH